MPPIRPNDLFFGDAKWDPQPHWLDREKLAIPQADESGLHYPFTADALLDRALGPDGYYGAFGANIHADVSESSDSEAIIASAQARGVPIISARQLLVWLDGRDSSSFGDLAWRGDGLEFTIAAADGARNLAAMLPTRSARGSLAAIQRNGRPVAYWTQAIKGIEYSFFPGESGAYRVVNAADDRRTSPGR